MLCNFAILRAFFSFLPRDFIIHSLDDLFPVFSCQAMSFNTGLSFEIYDLAGLGTDDVADESLVDDVVDAIVQAMDDVQEQLEEQEEQHQHAGGSGGQVEGDGQPAHSSVHHLLNASVAGNIPSSGQEV